MKRIFSLLTIRLLLVVCFSALCLNTSASFTVGNIIYDNVNGKTTVVGLRTGVKDLKIPSHVTYNGHRYTVEAIASPSRTIANSTLTSLTIPATVKEIKSHTYNDYVALKEVIIEDSDQPLTMGGGTVHYRDGPHAMFEGCPLEKLYLGRNIKIDDSNSSYYGDPFASYPQNYAYSPFFGQKGLTDVTIGPKVTELQDYLFYGLSSISTIKLPHVKTIGRYTFSRCNKLTTLSLGDALASVGECAFQYCTDLTNLAFPSTLKTLGDSAFYDCICITSTSFADGCQLERIGNSCFQYAQALTAFKCPETVSYIGGCAFKNCNRLVTIVLGNKIQSIGYETFKNDVALSDMIVPEGVTSIGDEAFSGCVGITVYSLPSTLQSIGEEVFANNTGLQTLTLPSNLSTMGKNCFYGCTRLSRLKFADGCPLKINSSDTKSVSDAQIAESGKGVYNNYFYDCPIKTLYIGKDLTYDYGTITYSLHADGNYYYINSAPFASKHTLKKVTFGKKVTLLNGYLFTNCDNLTDVILPESLENIKENAFDGCTSLSNLVFPDTLTIASDNRITIGDLAFRNCSSLKRLTFSGNLGRIERGVFKGCTSLQDVKFMDGWQSLNIAADEDAGDRKYAFHDCPLKTIYIGKNIYGNNIDYQLSPFKNQTGLSSVTISQSGTVTYLTNDLLNGCSFVSSLRLPESLKWIGDSTLSHMTSLTSITVPDGVTSIGAYCFSNDTLLATAKLSASLTAMNEGLFFNCIRLNRFVVPANVATIYNKVFFGCKSLSAITIPAATLTIKDDVFNGCVSLSNVTLNDGTRDLALGMSDPSQKTVRGMFRDCPVQSVYLGRSVTYNATSPQISPFAYISTLNQLTIGPEVSHLWKYAFTSCTALPKVYMTDSITSVGLGAFADCSKLDSVRFSNRLISLGDQAFSDCVTLKSAILPASLEALSERTFSGCTSLVNVHLGYALNTIGPYVFSGCTSLKTIEIPESVYGFGVGSFRNCTSLDHMTLPVAVRSIGRLAFQNDSAMQWVSIGYKTVSIGEQAFDGCTGLKYINSYNTTPPEGLAGFAQDVYDNTTVYAPESAIDDYRESPTWENFKNFRSLVIVKLSSVTLDKETLHMKKGEQQKLSATVAPDNANNRHVGWRSSNESVVKVSADGTVTAVEAGSAYIEVYAIDGGPATAKCNVTVDSLYISSIKLNETDVKFHAGDTKQLKATIAPANATDPSYFWTSSDPKIVSVSNDGTIKGIVPGKATITVQANDGGGAKAVCHVKVDSIYLSSITLNIADTTIFVGDKIWPTTKVSPSNATDPTVVYTSSNPDVATVSNFGNVKGISPGTAVITASAKDGGGAQAFCRVTVKYILRGDCNGDGFVNILDECMFSNITWQNKYVRGMDMNAADANCDGEVNPEDRDSICKLIVQQAVPFNEDTYTQYYRIPWGYNLTSSMEQGSKELKVYQSRGIKETNIQVDFHLPNGAEVADVDGYDTPLIFNYGRGVSWNMVNPTTLRVRYHSDIFTNYSSITTPQLLFKVIFNNVVFPSDIKVDHLLAVYYDKEGGYGVVGRPFFPEWDGDVATSIPATITSDKPLTSVNGGLLVKGMAGTAVSVYTVNGMLVKSVTVASDNEKISLPHGLYIVKAGGKATKVLIR